VSHFHKPTPKMNPCFLFENSEQTPLVGGARVGVAHRRREEAWRLQFDLWKQYYVVACVAVFGKLRRSRRLNAVQSGCTTLSIFKQGTSWSSPTPATLGLFWAPHPTTASSRRPAHHPPEAQPAT
jgi:hypothetical protein